jgi:gag-polypeptide of LTR copia-type
MPEPNLVFNFEPINPNANQTSSIWRTDLDFNSSQKLTNVPLNGRNYISWAKAVRVTLKGKGLLSYINGNKIRPTSGVEAQEEGIWWIAKL